MLRIRKSALAEADLIDIWLSTYDRWGEQQAEKYFGDLATQISNIAANPEIGRARNEIRSGYRSWPVGRHIVFYTLTADAVHVVRVLHGQMDPDGHL